MNYIRLNNGVEVPQLGVGVYMINDAKVCTRNVLDAIGIGYRHIDTAQVYHNEKAVGDAVAACGVKREELFITSKVWTSNYGYRKCTESLERSLNRLQTEYIDLMLLHRPFGDVAGAWRALEDALKAGKVRAIGLSNFVSQQEWNSVMQHANVVPAVNQVESHPYEQRTELKARMAAHDMALEAWYPLGHGDSQLMNEPVIAAMAKAHGKSNAQVVLRWHIQQGHIIFPKTLNPQHMRDNFNIFDFALTENEMQQMAALDRHTELFHSAKWLDQIMFRFMKA